MKHLFTLFFSFWSLSLVFSQVTLGEETFDGGGVGFTASVQFNDGTSDHFNQTDGTDIANVSGNYSFQDGTNMFWAAEDTDDNGGNGNDEQSVTFNPIGVSGFGTIEVCLDVAAGNENGLGSSNYDAVDYLLVQYNTDLDTTFIDGLCFRYFNNGDAFNEPLHHDVNCDGDGNDGPQLLTTAAQFCFNIPDAQTVDAGASSVNVRVLVFMDSASEEVAFDNFSVTGVAAQADCAITEITAGTQTDCDPQTNEYTQELTVTYENEPTTGNLVVNGQFFPISMSPQTVTLTGLDSDGQDVDVSANFDAEPTCSLDSLGLFTAPTACDGCRITELSAGSQTACDVQTNFYTQELTVTYENPPISGELVVNGQTFPITSSPQTVTLVDLESDGLPVDVSANFNLEPTCSLDSTALFTAPESCLGADCTFTAPADLCIDAGVQTGLGGGSPPGGEYFGPGVTDDGNGMTYTFDPAAAGVGVQTIGYSDPQTECVAEDSLEVFDLPTVTLATAPWYCLESPLQSAPITGGSPAGGVYSGPGVTDNGNGLTYNLDPTVGGPGVITITYTYTDPNGCTNSADSDIIITDCDIELIDPCACLDNATVIDNDAGTGGDDGQFSEVVSVIDRNGSISSGQTWSVVGATGAFDAYNIPASGTQSAGVPIPTDGSVTLVFDTIGGNSYDIPFVHIDSMGYELIVEGPFPVGSAANIMDTISNTCMYPNPVFDPAIAVEYNTSDPAVTLGGMDSNGNGSDAVTFTIDGNPETELDPSALAEGPHTIVMTFDGADDGNGGVGTSAAPASPGCIQTVRQMFDVIDCELIVDCSNISDVTLDCTQDIPDAVRPAILDSCGSVVVSVSDSTAGTTCDTSFLFRTYTIADTDPPFFLETPPADTTIDCAAMIPDPAMLTADDLCSAGGGGGGSTATVWINEFHYDNSGSDVNEFVEVAGIAGTDLSDYEIVLYNGSNGTSYNTRALSGIIPDEGAGYGAVAFVYPSNGLQNGSPDGIALNNVVTGLVEFLSYEGTMTGSGGPADGVMSTNVGVSETSGTPAGESLQLEGLGTGPSDFTWGGPLAESPGSLNAGQTIATSMSDIPVVFSEMRLSGLCASQDTIMRMWTAMDACGNDTTVTQLIFLIDNEGPSFTGPADVTIDCEVDPTDLSITGDVTGAADNCGDVMISFMDNEMLDGCGGYTGTIERMWMVADQCGNDSMFTQIITVQDTTPPTFTVPADAIVECTEVPADTADTGVPTDVLDNCTGVEQVDVWINEFHYDNSGTDAGEFIELAGTAGESLADYFVTFYNGSNGLAYGSLGFAGTFPDEGNGFGAVSGLFVGIQNGAPDGIALIKNGNEVVEFISYEGSFTAVDGPAAGQTSTDIGVFEDFTTAIGESLQRTGTGSKGVDFTWSGPAAESPGMLNADQTLIALPALEMIEVSFTDEEMLDGCGGTGTIIRTWTATDACGNSSEQVQTITVGDNSGPMVVCQDITVQLDENGMAMIAPEDVVMSAMDSCSDVTLSIDRDMFTCDNIGNGIVTVTAEDACGNTSTCEATVTIEDNVPPTINCPDDITVNLEAGACDAIVNYNVTAEDACALFEMGFAGYFAPANWDVSATGSAMIDVFDASTLTMTSADAGIPAGALAQIEIPIDGVVTFSWDWETQDLGNADGDPFGYVLNGAFTPLTDPTGDDIQSGSAMVNVTEGDQFGLLETSNDGLLGSATVTVSNFAAPSILSPILVDGLESGAVFPEGTTTVTYEVFDNNGNRAECSFDVNVLPFPDPLTQLTCIGEINVSLDDNCTAMISADEILTGGPYKCLEQYEICIEGLGCNLGMMMVGTDQIGQRLEVSVVDPETGNSCWGYVNVEDKLPPVLECVDITIECDAEIPETPGISELAEFTVVGDSDAADPDLMILDRRDIRIPIQVDEEGLVADLNIGLRFAHDFADDLQIRLVAPNGFSGFDFATGCQDVVDFWDVLFDDEAIVTVAACDDLNDPGIQMVTPALFGLDPLTAFDGLEIQGEWNLIVRDNADGDTGLFSEVYLEFTVEDAEEDNGFDTCLGETDLTFEDEIDDILCDGEFSTIITRTWTLTDAQGNSSSCDQIINLRRKTLADLTLPPDWDGIADTDPWGFQPALSCVDQCGSGIFNGTPDWNTVVNKYGMTVPSPTASEDGRCFGTGEPGGIDCGTIQAAYEDQIIDVCTGSYKVIRRWTVVDWCTGDLAEHTQLIKVENLEPVQLTCPADQEAFVSGHDCTTGVQLILPTASSACGAIDPADFVPTVSSGRLVNENGTWFVLDVTLGTITVTWTIEDDCGNEGTCSYNIEVIDNLPPVAVCETFRKVGLSNEEGGFSKVFADAFDDGSNDNCSPEVWFKVLRMQDEEVDNAPHGSRSVDPNAFTCGGAAGDDQPSTTRTWEVWFDDYVKFCCEDIANDDIQVIFRVYDVDPGEGPVFPSRHSQGGDLFGRYNDCMVNVEVEDKLPPLVVCPPDVTIDCDDPFELDNLDIYGTATVFDNCGATIAERVIEPSDCSAGQRVIRRVFTATDNGNGLTSQCIQNIFIIDPDPFKICDTRDRTFPLNPENNCTNQNDPDFHTRGDGVEWPADIELFSCVRDVETELAPENLGTFGVDRRDREPEFFGTQCAQLAYDYEDEVFYIVEDACFKVIRTWTVIDWCQFDAVTRDPEDPERFLGYWQYIQIIKVQDEIAPVLGMITFEEDCLDTDDDCNVRATLTVEATDDCNLDSELEYRWSIDAFNDGTFDFSGTGNFVSDYLPAGTHLIRFVARDLCDNDSEPQDLVFTVGEECKAPTPYCDNGIATVVMPSSGCVEVWAVDLDEGSFDNCTDQEDLVFTMRKLDDNGEPIGIRVPALEFCCEDIPNGRSQVCELEICVTDEAGNTDCCITYIELQDTPDEDNPEGVCPDCDVTLATPEFVEDCMDTDEDCNVRSILSASLDSTACDIDPGMVGFLYQIDAFNDGTSDIPGVGNQFDGYLPTGTHKITFFATDENGNDLDPVELVFTVSAPCPTLELNCNDAVVELELDDTGTVTITAASLIEDALDPCIDAGDLTVTIDGSETIGFDCDDITDVDITVTIVVMDGQGNSDSCERLISVTDPLGSCVNCEIDNMVANVICDDNDTPADPEDDVFFFEVVVSGMDTGAGWSANDPNNTTGAYDATVTFGPYAIADGNLAFTISDNDDPNCVTEVEVFAPAPCSMEELCTTIYGITTQAELYAINVETGEFTFLTDAGVNGTNALCINPDLGLAYFGNETTVFWIDINTFESDIVGTLNIPGILTNGAGEYFNESLYLGSENPGGGGIVDIFRVELSADGKSFNGGAVNISNGLVPGTDDFGDFVVEEGGIGNEKILISAVDLPSRVNSLARLDVAAQTHDVVLNFPGPSTAQLTRDNAGNFWLFENSTNMLSIIDIETGDLSMTVPVGFSFADLGQSYCSDSMNIVPELTGTLRTEFGKRIAGHDVLLESNTEMMAKMSSSRNGKYAFASADGVEFVKPFKNDDSSNGLSTQDLIIIQRHILGVDDLDSPYQMIAADADRNEQINVLDLIDIQRVILQLDSEFRNNKSWRYVSSSQRMDMNNPYRFEEPLAYRGQYVQNFIGVKTGDVNGSADVALEPTLNELDTRNALELIATRADATIESDEVRYEVRSEDFEQIDGYQFTLEIGGAQFERIESGLLEISEAQVAQHDGGVVTTNWFTATPVTAAADDVLFTIVVRDTDRAELKATSLLTDAEAYSNGDIRTIDLRTSEGASIFTLYQNEPNPFVASTTITFDMPNAAMATVTVLDATGKMIYTRDMQAVAGSNILVITSEELNTSAGVLYYRVDTDNYSATKKMIRVE